MGTKPGAEGDSKADEGQCPHWQEVRSSQQVKIRSGESNQGQTHFSND